MPDKLSLLCLLLFLSAAISLPAQQKLSWDDLYAVQFEATADSGWLCPTFSADIQAKEGYEVYLSGYVLPLSAAQGMYVLSSFPYASCFFCGGAGPESVIQLELKRAARPYRTDEWKRFKGILRLNGHDPAQLHYILEDAAEY